MPTTQPRKYHTEQVHAVRGRVAYNQSGVAAGVEIGKIPAGSFVFPPMVKVETAFNGTTPVVAVGTTADDDGFATSAGIAPAAAGFKNPTTGAQLGNITADESVFVKITVTDTTAGLVDVIVPYYPHAA